MAGGEGFDVDELGADAERGGACRDELGDGGQADASRGEHLDLGEGPLSARRYFAPPTAEQGKIFTMSEPAFHAVMTSVGVSAPGITGTLRACAASMVSWSRPGSR